VVVVETRKCSTLETSSYFAKCAVTGGPLLRLGHRPRARVLPLNTVLAQRPILGLCDFPKGWALTRKRPQSNALRAQPVVLLRTLYRTTPPLGA
jgi:hypothetical protein